MSTSYSRPGAFIEEVMLPQQVPTLNLDVAVGAFIGAAERGTVATPLYISNWSEYYRTYGGFKRADGTDYPMAYQAYMFFTNGGRGCWVLRVASSDAEQGTALLSDNYVTVGGTNAASNVLLVQAASPGDWSLTDSANRGVSVVIEDQTTASTIETAVRADNALTVTTSYAHGLTVGDAVRIEGLTDATMSLEVLVTAVTDASTFKVANTGTPASIGTAGIPTTGKVTPSEGRFALSVLFGGTSTGYFVEKFADLSMNPASDRYALRVVNLSSQYVNLQLPVGFTPGQIESKDIFRNPGPTAVPAGLGRTVYDSATSTKTITTATFNSGTGVATITTPTAHGFIVGDTVTVQGVVVNSSLQNGFNGTFTVASTTTVTPFTFTYSTTGATGTVTVSENSTASVTSVVSTVKSTSFDGSPVTATMLTGVASALDTLSPNLVVNIPDAALLSQVDARRVYTTYLSKVDERADSFLIMDTPTGLLPSEALSFAADITPKSANSAIYYPSLQVADPGSTGSVSVIKTLPPGGAVAGLYLSTDASRGAWKSPAGVQAVLNSVLALERNLSSSELDTLNTAASPVNAIRPIPGSGNCVMGARTMGLDPRFRYVATRRAMLQIKKKLLDITQFAVFESNDENLWTRIRTVIEVYLQEVWQQGGLRGVTPRQAFFVRCDGTNNNAQSIASGQVLIEVGVALQTPAEFVVIKIGQFEGGATATVQE